MYTNILTEIDAGVGIITLNRPERHNAFDDALIAELSHAIDSMADDPAVRVLVISSTGKSFCAGADLNWMKRAAGYGEDENLRDSRALAGMLRRLAQCPKPTIARVQGPAYGGGVGLVAACDIAVATFEAQFALTEVKLGIIPSVISPYVLRAVGPRHALRIFQSAERVPAERALAIGLVGEVVAVDALDAAVAALAETLISGAPQAQKAAKDLIAAVTGRPIDDTVSEETAQRIARQRATDEARDGITAFLEKRQPAWLL